MNIGYLWEVFKQFFKKKKKLVVFFIDEAGRVIKKSVRYNNNTFSTKKVGKDEQAYIVDQQMMLYERRSGLPVSFYYVNNPHPLSIRHQRNEELDSIGFQKILDSKAITDLFASSNDKKMLLLVILVIVNLVVSIVILLINFKIIKVGGAT